MEAGVLMAGVGRPAGHRDGFTIVEVLLALVLLSFVVMGFQAATGEIIRYSGQSDQQSLAVQLAEDRLDLIRLDPDYAGIPARYAGVEEGVATSAALTRTTRIVRTRKQKPTGVLDYLTITVTVEGASLREPVARTVVVAAP